MEEIVIQVVQGFVDKRAQLRDLLVRDVKFERVHFEFMELWMVKFAGFNGILWIQGEVFAVVDEREILDVAISPGLECRDRDFGLIVYASSPGD